MSRSEIIPRIASLLVTTRAPTFLARNQSAALLMLASGVIVATSVPFWLKMLSTFMALSSCIAAELDVAFAGIGSIILSPSRERGCADLYVKRALLAKAYGSVSRYLLSPLS